MSIDRFFVRPATIVHPATVAGYGDGIVYDYDHPASTVDVMGWFDQLFVLRAGRPSEEQSGTRDVENTSGVFRVPAGTVVSSTDRVILEGETFDVDGPPKREWTPSGEHHVKMALRRVDG